MMPDLQPLHDLVHVLLNVVSVLNTILLAVDALFGANGTAARSRRSAEPDATARR